MCAGYLAPCRMARSHSPRERISERFDGGAHLVGRTLHGHVVLEMHEVQTADIGFYPTILGSILINPARQEGFVDYLILSPAGS